MGIGAATHRRWLVKLEALLSEYLYESHGIRRGMRLSEGALTVSASPPTTTPSSGSSNGQKDVAALACTIIIDGDEVTD
jgi:hypothetical protein